MKRATHATAIDHILIDRAPGQTRLLLCCGQLDGDVEVIEAWFDRCDFRNLTGSIHRVRLAMNRQVQNRAMATLADGTRVSVRLGKQDRVGDGDSAIVTVVAAPRDGKPWQAVSGARLAGRTMVLLPGQSGVSVSRQITNKPSEALMNALVAKVGSCSTDVGIILRREAANQEASAILNELEMLLTAWGSASGPSASDSSAGASADLSVAGASCLYDGGDLVARARRLAPEAQVLDMVSAEEADLFAAVWDDAMEAASQSDIRLAGGGVIWMEPTRALTALDLDSADGSLDALMRQAPTAIARHLRLRVAGGVVAIDVPRASPAAFRQFVQSLDAELACDPRRPERLGTSPAGLMEIRIPHGQPGPAAYLANDAAVRALSALRQIALAPQLARPHLYAPQDVIDWLRGPGQSALKELATRLDRQTALGVSSHGVIIQDGPFAGES